MLFVLLALAAGLQIDDALADDTITPSEAKLLQFGKLRNLIKNPPRLNCGPVDGAGVFITSVPSFLVVGKEKSPELPVLFRKPPSPLWIFTDTSWDKLHGEEGVSEDFAKSVLGADCVIDLFEVVPQLTELLRNYSHIDALYDLPSGVQSLTYKLKDGKALIRKVLSMHLAVNNLDEGKVVTWTDVDVGWHGKLENARGEPSPMLEYVLSRDMTYWAETPCHGMVPSGTESPWDLPAFCHDYKIESGIVLFKIGTPVKTLLSQTLKLYDGAMYMLVTYCMDKSRLGRVAPCDTPWVLNNFGLNDVFTLMLSIHTVDLKHGWITDENFKQAITPQRPVLFGACRPFHIEKSGEKYLIGDFKSENFVHHTSHEGAMRARDWVSVYPEMQYPRGAAQPIDARYACADERAKSEQDYYNKDMWHQKFPIELNPASPQQTWNAVAALKERFGRYEAVVNNLS